MKKLIKKICFKPILASFLEFTKKSNGTEMSLMYKQERITMRNFVKLLRANFYLEQSNLKDNKGQ